MSYQNSRVSDIRLTSSLRMSKPPTSRNPPNRTLQTLKGFWRLLTGLLSYKYYVNLIRNLTHEFFFILLAVLKLIFPQGPTIPLRPFDERPGPTCLAPRDGLSLSTTKDVLFLAMLLARAGTSKYFLELEKPYKQRAVIPEPIGFTKGDTIEGFKVKSRTSEAAIRNSIRKQYFQFRESLSEAKKFELTIRINNVTLNTSSSGISAFGSKLKWPFKLGVDSLLQDLHEISFFTWDSSVKNWDISNLSSLDHTDIPGSYSKEEDSPRKVPSVTFGLVQYCSLDGAVLPLKVKLRTPLVSGSAHCSSEWIQLVCPHCLGLFEHRRGWRS